MPMSSDGGHSVAPSLALSGPPGISPIPSVIFRALPTSMAANGKPLYQYQFGLCDCSYSWSTCFQAFFMPCVLECKMAQRLGEETCYPVCFGSLPLATRFRTVAGIKQDMCVEGIQYTICRW